MNRREKSKLTTLNRCHSFIKISLKALKDHPTFVKLDKALEELNAYAPEQRMGKEHSKVVTREKRAAYQQLLDCVIAMAGVARHGVGRKRRMHEIFRMPPHLNDTTLLTTAQKFATEAHRHAFVYAALPPNFARDFEAAIARYESAMKFRSSTRDKRIATTAGLKRAMADAFTALTQIDPVVRFCLRHDLKGLNEWKSARRVARPSPKKAKAKTAAAGSQEP